MLKDLMLDNKKFTIFKIITILIGLIVVKIILLNTNAKKIQEHNYIQNLEEKLNIYRESYEEFCLEDSKKQSDVYE